MSYFLGIDGGGTKTRFLLGDEDGVLATENTGGSNPIRLGVDAARRSLHEGIHGVSTRAGIQQQQVSSVCAGVAGAAAGPLRKLVREMIAEVVAGTVEVVGDMVVAHEAALDGAPGIVVNAGTGSIAYGRNEAGKTARAGGFGYVISDEGSGHWIGVQAVAWIARMAASGYVTVLSDRVLQRWKLESVDELVQYANTSPTPDFASLFHDVMELEGRVPGAGEILERAGVALAQLAEPVYRHLWQPWAPVQVALTGGVFHNSATVRAVFNEQMKDLRLNACIRLSDVDPAAGALALARKLISSSTVQTT